MSKHHVTIATPCTVSWNSMTAAENGKHCALCNKVVIDFSAMTDSEIQHYFKNIARGEKVCGLFRQSQLATTPKTHFLLRFQQYVADFPRLPFKALCLLIIGTMVLISGCESKTMGESTYEMDTSTVATDSVSQDTTQASAIRP